MLYDLILGNEVLENHGFDKIKKVKINKIKDKKDINKIKQDLIIIEGGKFNREILESKKVHILLSPEKYKKEDFLHHRASGLNQVLCKLAKKNRIAIGISFNDILNSKERKKLLGRIAQNIKLCRKYKVRMIFASFAKSKYEMRPAKDMINFVQTLGMTPKEALNSLNLDIVLKEKQEINGIKEV